MHFRCPVLTSDRLRQRSTPFRLRAHLIQTHWTNVTSKQNTRLEPVMTSWCLTKSSISTSRLSKNVTSPSIQCPSRSNTSDDIYEATHLCSSSSIQTLIPVNSEPRSQFHTFKRSSIRDLQTGHPCQNSIVRSFAVRRIPERKMGLHSVKGEYQRLLQRVRPRTPLAH